MFSQSRLHTAYETFICYKKKKVFGSLARILNGVLTIQSHRMTNT